MKLFTPRRTLFLPTFYATESAGAVPIDQIIVYPNQTIPARILPKGKSRIGAMDKTGKILNKYEKR